MRHLGIDYGDKKVGIAFGDTGSGVAVPLEVIRNNGSDIFTKIIELIKSEAVESIVVGVPLATAGGDGSPQLEKVRNFIRRLQKQVEIPVVEEDERYSTVEAIRLQREEGATAEDDALAAMLILQAHLDQVGGEDHK